MGVTTNTGSTGLSRIVLFSVMKENCFANFSPENLYDLTKKMSACCLFCLNIKLTSLYIECDDLPTPLNKIVSYKKGKKAQKSIEAIECDYIIARRHPILFFCLFSETKKIVLFFCNRKLAWFANS